MAVVLNYRKIVFKLKETSQRPERFSRKENAALKKTQTILTPPKEK